MAGRVSVVGLFFVAGLFGPYVIGFVSHAWWNSILTGWGWVG